MSTPASVDGPSPYFTLPETDPSILAPSQRSSRAATTFVSNSSAAAASSSSSSSSHASAGVKPQPPSTTTFTVAGRKENAIHDEIELEPNSNFLLALKKVKHSSAFFAMFFFVDPFRRPVRSSAPYPTLNVIFFLLFICSLSLYGVYLILNNQHAARNAICSTTSSTNHADIPNPLIHLIVESPDVVAIGWNHVKTYCEPLLASKYNQPPIESGWAYDNNSFPHFQPRLVEEVRFYRNYSEAYHNPQLLSANETTWPYQFKIPLPTRNDSTVSSDSPHSAQKPTPPASPLRRNQARQQQQQQRHAAAQAQQQRSATPPSAAAAAAAGIGLASDDESVTFERVVPGVIVVPLCFLDAGDISDNVASLECGPARFANGSFSSNCGYDVRNRLQKGYPLHFILMNPRDISPISPNKPFSNFSGVPSELRISSLDAEGFDVTSYEINVKASTDYFIELELFTNDDDPSHEPDYWSVLWSWYTYDMMKYLLDMEDWDLLPPAPPADKLQRYRGARWMSYTVTAYPSLFVYSRLFVRLKPVVQITTCHTTELSWLAICGTLGGAASLLLFFMNLMHFIVENCVKGAKGS